MRAAKMNQTKMMKQGYFVGKIQKNKGSIWYYFEYIWVTR